MNSDQLNKIKDSRKGKNAVYLDYVFKNRKDEDSLHCFFEGKTDENYYLPRIEKVFNFLTEEKIKKYTCYSKSEVISLARKIQEIDQKATKNLLFFVDKDFDENQFLYKDWDVYMTPFHSIENFYTHKNTFIKVVFKENSWNNSFPPDFLDNNRKFLSKFYDKELNVYLQRIKLLGAWFMSHIMLYNEKSNVDLSNLKLNPNTMKLEPPPKLGVLQKKTGQINIDYLKSITPNFHSDIEDHIENYELHVINKPFDYLRGKYFFPFIVHLLNSLKHNRRNVMLDGVQLDTSNGFCINTPLDFKFDLLSILSLHAHTPDCLINYLKYKSEKYISVA